MMIDITSKFPMFCFLRNDDTLEVSGDAMLSPHRSFPTAESPVPGAASGASGSSTPQPGSPQTLAEKLGKYPLIQVFHCAVTPLVA